MIKTAEIKWIKLSTDVFDNRKIKQLEQLPDGDTIIVIWLKLLCLAGVCNDNGIVYFTPDIPYTEQMLATQFNRPVATIQLALNMFQQYGMIDVIDNFMHISSWEKYQNIEGMEKVREQTRKRVSAFRERQKALPEQCNVTGNVTETQSNGTDIDLEEESEVEGLTLSKESVCRTKDVQRIVTAWNTLGLQQVQKVTPTSKRGAMLRARVNEYGVDAVLQAIEKVRQSDFLKGGKDFVITFDWFVKPNNFPKVLEGNYDNRGGRKDSGTNNIFLEMLGDEYGQNTDH